MSRIVCRWPGGDGQNHWVKVIVLTVVSVTVAACAAPGYRYVGGMGIGSASLVDSRADMTTTKGGQGHHPPDMVRQGKLAYPTWPLLQAACGTVTVKVYIDVKGQPHGAHVLKQHFNRQFVNDENTYKEYPIAPFFDQPAIDYVMSSKFEPGRVNDEPKGMSIAIPINFVNNLDGKCGPR